MPDSPVINRYTAKEFAEIRQAMLDVEKNNASGTADTHNPPYGPYADGSGDFGVLSYPGTRPNMFSAVMRPRSLASLFGVRPSLVANEKIGIVTGVSAEEGTNPADFCGVFPTAGQLKRCVQNYIFGKSAWKTKVVNVAELGEYADFGDMTAKRIVNINQTGNPFVPDLMNRLDVSDRDAATLANELGTTGIGMERGFEKVLVTGNSTKPNTLTQVGWIKEFDGLERQVVQGRRDLDSQDLCPGADSTIIPWGTGIEASVSGRTFPQTIVDTYFALSDIADQTGMYNTRWVIAMRFEEFRALTYIWACEYWISRCQGSAGNPNAQMASEVRNLQLQMFNGKYLLIDGTPVQVVFSDGIPLTKAGTGVYTAQDVFILAVESMGFPLLNLEYKPMANKDAMTFSGFIGPQVFQPFNNGMWLGTKQQTAFCLELLWAGKFRMILDAPFLSAVINTTQFQFSAPIRSYDPNNTEWYKGGGASRWDGNYGVA